MNWNKIILHSLYVGGITFFSTISQLFTDGVLLNVDINNAIITSFIAMGLAFFTGWGVQNNDTYIPNIKVTYSYLSASAGCTFAAFLDG